MRAHWLIVVVALCACDDETTEPQSVPFEGLDPGVQPKRPEVTVDPEPTPSSSVDTPPAPPKKGKPTSGGGRVSRCCAALALVAKTSPIPGHRQNANSASRTCVTKRSQVEQGSLGVETALSQVRSALAFPAPGACK